MPNGDNKVWVRTSSAIAAFRHTYGKWPTRLCVPERSPHVAAAFGGEENLRRIERRLDIIRDESLPDFESIAVEDDEGNRVEYPACGLEPSRDVDEWIPLVFNH